MPTYSHPTKAMSISNAKAFIASLNASDGRTSASKKSTILYACLGKNTPWPDESSPPAPPQNVEYENQILKDNFIGGKKIDTGSVSHVVPRKNWVSGTVYSMYRDTATNLFSDNASPFYVVTDQLNVYKCLFNNKKSASTVKPTGFSTLPFTASDGYTWKYLYTISLGEADKFMTSVHMPVKTVSATDGSTESDRLLAVQAAAVDGAIQVIETNTSGVGYDAVVDASVAAAVTTQLTVSQAVDVAISDNNDRYNGSSVYVVSGTGAGQLRRIVNYNGSTRTLTVNTAFTTVPNTTSKVNIAPTVTIIGDGSGAKAYAHLNAAGAVANISVINVGSKYTKAIALISANSTHGSGATANVVISPKGGHGSDCIAELGGDKVALNIQFQGSEGVSANGNGYIPSNTEFRTISILKDPVLKCNSNNEFRTTESVANTSNSPSTLRMTTRATISYQSMNGADPVSELQVRDVIINERNRLRAEQGVLEFVTVLGAEQRKGTYALQSSLQAANAQIVFIREDETQTDTSFYTAYLNNVSSYSTYAPFTKDDVLLKSGSETKVATIQQIKGPEANTASGEILYTENISAATKSLDQVEDIKIILDF